MTQRIKLRPVTISSWNIYLARYSPTKWIGNVEAADADDAIMAALKEFNVSDPRKLLAVRQV